MSEQFNNGYALLIGVGEYKAKNLTVMQAAYDAEDLRGLLINPTYCGYLDHQVKVLANQQATQSAIVTALQTLANNIEGKEATVIIMFSGHGYNQDGSFYFLPHDTEFIYGNHKITGIKTQSAISNEVLVNQIRTISQRANKTLVIFHSCHAGGMGTAFGLDNDDDLIEQLRPISFEVFDTSYQDLAHGKGTAILASSQQNQLSWAFGPRNSLFMEQVLAVLKGDGIAATEKYVELLPFIDVVKKSVRTMAEQRGKQQDPDYRVYGGMEGDFRIALRLGGKAMSIIEPIILPKPVLSQEVKKMSGIPPKVYNEMRQVLLDCTVFSNMKELKDIFVDSRISLWKNGLPMADNYEGLVQSVMAYLHQKTNINNENGLVLFLEVLLDKVDPNDKCHVQLAEVARSFKLAVSGGDSADTLSFSLADIDNWNRQSEPQPTPSEEYNYGAIRDLMNETFLFNPEDLQTLVADTPQLKSVIAKFRPNMNLAEKTDQIISYCRQNKRIPQLLAAIKKRYAEAYQEAEATLHSA